MKKVEKMNWKIISIILVVILAAVAVSGCIGSPVSDADDKITADDSANITEDGTYDTKDEVAAYIIKYHKLPSNYITKSEARSLGWSWKMHGRRHIYKPPGSSSKRRALYRVRYQHS